MLHIHPTGASHNITHPQSHPKFTSGGKAHLRKRKDKRKDKLRTTRNRCAIVVPSSASFFRRCQSTSFARRAAIPASTSVAFFRSSVSLSLTQQSSSKDVYLWLTYVSYLHDSSCHFTLFHIKKQSKMLKGRKPSGPTLQASTIGFTRRSTNACIAQPRRHTTRATCHGPGHIVVAWRLVLAGCGAWAEKHQTRAVSDSTVEVLFMLSMLSYMHLNSMLFRWFMWKFHLHSFSFNSLPLLQCLCSTSSVESTGRQTKKHTLW